MSVREEDRQKNCRGRGLGIAAAAIGVGVGAALYYFFSKRTENPDAEGSTSNWTCEEPHALHATFNNTEDMDTSSESLDTSYDSTSSYQETTQNEDNTEYDSTEESSQSENSFDYETIANNENSYITISEHSTTDTSINETATDVELSQNDMDLDSPMEHITTPDRPLNDDDDDDYIFERRLNVLRFIVNRVRDRSSTRRRPKAEEIQRQAKLREQAFRERSWAVEDCSICFESMQRNQEVMALPCTHRFHQACILTWLQERSTCPMCRKDA